MRDFCLQGRKGMRDMLRLISVAGILPGLCCLAVGAWCVGCMGLAGDGAKIVEGTDLTVGMSLPYAETSDVMAVINFISGFRVLVAENARATVEYSSTTTNDWFGVVTSLQEKRIKAAVEPTVSEEEETPETTSPARATETSEAQHRADGDVSHDPTKEPTGTAGNSSTN